MPAHWPKLERIYNQALELDPAERAAFLSEACQGDRELRDEIESLLANASAGGAVFPTSAWSVPTNVRVPARDPLDAGTVLGNYRIVNKVGEGVIGILYEAVDTRLTRKVALRVVRNELLVDTEACQQFERAAREVGRSRTPTSLRSTGSSSTLGLAFSYSSSCRRDSRGPVASRHNADP